MFDGGNDFSETLTRAKLEEFDVDLFRKTLEPVEKVLKDAGPKEDINNPYIHPNRCQTGPKKLPMQVSC